MSTQNTLASKIDWSKIDQPELVLQRFPSRRSVVYGTKGVVASSQPLATEAGLEILRAGGNAGTFFRVCVISFGYPVFMSVSSSGCSSCNICSIECY